MLNPLVVLREAIGKVPSMRYALAVAGIVAVVSIARSWFQLPPRIAVVGAVIVVALMVVLVVFAQLSMLKKSSIAKPAAVLMWFTLIMFMLFVLALFMSVFFGWPLNLERWMTGESEVVSSSTATVPKAPEAPPSQDVERTTLVYRECRIAANGVESAKSDVRNGCVLNQPGGTQDSIRETQARDQVLAALASEGHQGVVVVKADYMSAMEGHGKQGGVFSHSVFNRCWAFHVTYDPVYKLARNPACGTDTGTGKED